MKNLTKSIILGTVTLGCGTVIGWKLCKAAIVSMLMEKKIGKEKLERMAKIYYDTGANVKDKDIVLASRSDAEEVLTQLRDLLYDYGVVTVSDLYDLVGITSKFTDNKYGWTNLKTAVIKGVRTGYLLDLPTPQEIK